MFQKYSWGKKQQKNKLEIYLCFEIISNERSHNTVAGCKVLDESQIAHSCVKKHFDCLVVCDNAVYCTQSSPPTTDAVIEHHGAKKAIWNTPPVTI